MATPFQDPIKAIDLSQDDESEEKTLCADPAAILDASENVPIAIEPSADVVGTVFAGGRYRIIEPIGSGGMASVYKALDETIKRHAAIKLMLPKYMVDPDSMIRFQQEATAASRLDHVNIVRVYEFGATEDGRPYLVMEYVSGKTLSSLIKEAGKLDIATTVRIMVQTCEALIHAHENGVVHRDLKPSNIMLVNDVVKIVDFGIAKLLSDEETSPITLTQTGEVFGSPPYMSPEQGLGRDIDQRSDLYSLGCVMYECLTGSPPLMGATALETLIKHQTEAAPSLEAGCFGRQFPEEIEKVVAKLLERIPRKRYQSAAELKTDLLDFEAGHLDIARFLKQPQEPERSHKRQDLSDFFNRANRSARENLDQLKEPVKPVPLVDKAMGGIVWLLVICGVLVVVFLTAEVTASLTRVTPAKPAQRPTQEGAEVTEPTSRVRDAEEKRLREDQVEQLEESEFPSLDVGGWPYTPAQWKRIANINGILYLNASNSMMNDECFTTIACKWRLMTLNLSGCENITADGLAKLSSLASLRELDLSGMPSVNGKVVDFLPPNLEALSLSRTAFPNEGLRKLASGGKAKKLKSLELSECSEVTAEGLAFLKSLPALESLTLSALMITEPASDVLAEVKTLREMTLFGAPRRVERLARLKQLRRLTVIDLDMEAVRDPLGGLRRLQEACPNLLIHFAVRRVPATRK